MMATKPKRSPRRKIVAAAPTIVSLPTKASAAAPGRVQLTAEQQAWLNTHRNYARISGRLKAFQARGTLRPDGTFVPERGRAPVTIGNGAFGVGIPVPALPRRRR